MPRFYVSAALITAFVVSLSACSNAQNLPKSAVSKTVVTHLPQKPKAESHHPKWSYEGDTGPKYWGDFEDAGTCKSGQEQSPINIQKVAESRSAAPAIRYNKNASIRINDNGHTIVYTPTTPDNSITINNERFELKQFHYHTPSEHQFGGQSYPAEMHFVHANSAGSLAVIGVMLKQGVANNAAGVLLNGTHLSAENQVDFTVNNVDLNTLIPKMPTFYHYNGSLTTPPCSEQVKWFVANQPVDLAADQLAVMTALYEGNNRPVQSQGTRKVEQLSQ